MQFCAFVDSWIAKWLCSFVSSICSVALTPGLNRISFAIPLSSSEISTFVETATGSQLLRRWRNTLESEIYQESLIGVAVDEVHCVIE